jgi:hypothetical protein
LIELEAIWHEWETGKPATAEPEGYVNPAAMDDWAADSIEARQALKAGAFE